MLSFQDCLPPPFRLCQTILQQSLYIKLWFKKRLRTIDPSLDGPVMLIEKSVLCPFFQSSSPCCHGQQTEIKFIIQLWIYTGLRHDPHRTQVPKDFICKVLEDFVGIFLSLLAGRAPQKYRGISPMPISCPNR